MKFLDKSALFKIILIIVMACLGYTVLSTSVSWIEPTDWGLVTKLPLVYYAGLVFLGFLWYVGIKSKSYLPVALILTVAYVYVAPAIVRVPVWTSNSYYPFGESLLINSTGHLGISTAPTIGNYHYWPLFLYFASALTIVTGVPDYFLLKFFPLITVSMYGILALLILRIKLAPRYAYMGAGLVLASLFIRQQYFGPQSVGYLFFLAILLVFSLLFFGDGSNRRTLFGVLIFLFFVATLSHALTSFMSLCIFYAAYFVDILFKKKRSATLSLVATIIWVGYNFFFSVTFFDEGFNHFIEIFSGSREVSLYSVGSRLVGSTAQQINFAASWVIVGLGSIIALISIVYIIKNRRYVKAYSIFNVAVLIMIGLFAFVGEYGPQESFTRAFMFGLLPLSFLCVSFLARKPALIVVLLTVLIFVNIPAQYGADSYRLATDTQLAGMEFITFYTPDGISIIGQSTLYIKYYNPMKNYTVLEDELTSPFNHVPNSTIIAEQLAMADYVVLSDIQHNYFMFYIGEDPLEQADFRDFNRVYDNGAFAVFKP